MRGLDEWLTRPPEGLERPAKCPHALEWDACAECRDVTDDELAREREDEWADSLMD